MADVQLSKSLSWLLRHNAHKLGLRLTSDGYVPVDTVIALNHPRFRKKGRPLYTTEDVVRVVENNNKQRFRLEMLVFDDDSESVLCIRANQGHSLKGIESDELLTRLTDEVLSGSDLLIIHGTTRKAWEEHIRQEGLSRMKRNHIHFATGLPEKTGNDEGPRPISGMRSTSEIYIYIDGKKCAGDGVPFYRSDNGVILTAGVNEKGILPTSYFDKVVYAPSGKVLWGRGIEKKSNAC